MAVRARGHSTQAPTLAEVIAVIRDYVSELRLPSVTIPLPSRRAAFVGLGASLLALILSEAFFVGPLGKVMLVLPLLGIATSGAAAWLATPPADPNVTPEREAVLRAELDALADSRVALVIRQFEWAVNDVETLRQAVRKADAARTAAEKKSLELDLRVRQFRQMVEQAQTKLAAHAAEPIRLPEATFTPEPVRTVALRWSLHDAGAMQWLRLEGDETGAGRVRLLDAAGRVVTISNPGEPTSARADGPVGVTLEMSVPPEILIALGTGELTEHRFEALVGDEWRAVALSDSGSRTGTTRDKRSRFFAVDAIRTSA